MDSDGMNIKQITDLPGNEHAPSWSPDGKALAFNRLNFEGSEQDKYSLHIEELKK